MRKDMVWARGRTSHAHHKRAQSKRELDFGFFFELAGGERFSYPKVMFPLVCLFLAGHSR